jgi:ATP-binding cassette, subfamily B, bacterial
VGGRCVADQTTQVRSRIGRGIRSYCAPATSLLGHMRDSRNALSIVDTSLAVPLWALAVVAALVPIGISITMAIAVGASPQVYAHGLHGSVGHKLIGAVIAFAVLFAMATLVNAWNDPIRLRVERQVDGRLRERVMRAAMGPVGIAHLEDPTIIEAFEGARNMSPRGFSPGSAGGALPIQSGSRVTAIIAIVVAGVIWWPLGLVLLVLFPFNQIEMERERHRISDSAARRADTRFPDYHRDLSTAAVPGKEIRVFGLGSWLEDRYETSVRTTMASLRLGRKKRARSYAIVMAANVIVATVALLILALRSTHGELPVGQLALVIGALTICAPQMNGNDLRLIYGTLALARVEEVERTIDHDRTQPSVSEASSMGSPAATGSRALEIRFERVSFHYANSTVDVLEDLDLELRTGERIALVGLNGAGKTTIVKLLCKLYEPTAGRILVNGIDLATIDAREWRMHLAVLFQDFVRYELTARDNVRYGAPKAPSNDEALMHAARPVSADRVVAELPGAWDTPLSVRYANGVDLSGGQWQRLALARAMHAVDAGARLLVLDEPTANLDVRTEAELYEQIVEMTATEQQEEGLSLMTLLISHRFATVRLADRIVVLSDGRVVESGSHDTLVAAGGLYAEMFRVQAARFAEDDDANEPELQS